MKRITLLDKEFELSITEEVIQSAVSKLSDKINLDFKQKQVLFIAILNGSFMFASDLLKKIDFPCELAFCKIQSYTGTINNNVQEIIGLPTNIRNRNVIIIDDIVDTGNTLEYVVNKLHEQSPQSISVVSMFIKPEVYKKSLKINYIGLSVPNKFLVGYGLDYNGLGRNLTDVYAIM